MRETRDLEFKQSVSKTFLKTVSAFANYGTGTILFGVDDDGEVIGLEDPVGDALKIENMINDSIDRCPATLFLSMNKQKRWALGCAREEVSRTFMQERRIAGVTLQA